MRSAKEETVRRIRVICCISCNPINPADCKFIGKPIDFIAFPGAVSNKPISEILFIEVKSGNSVLSEREKEIKLAVEKGKVRYVEYRI